MAFAGIIYTAKEYNEVRAALDRAIANNNIKDRTIKTLQGSLSNITSERDALSSKCSSLSVMSDYLALSCKDIDMEAMKRIIEEKSLLPCFGLPTWSEQSISIQNKILSDELDAEIARRIALEGRNAELIAQVQALEAALKESAGKKNLANNSALFAMIDDLKASNREKDEKIAELEKTHADETAALNDRINELTAQNATKDAQILLLTNGAAAAEKIILENKNLNASKNTTSRNSSNPPSTDKPDAPRGNFTRQPTENKPGGQEGHEGHWLSPEEAERIINDKDTEAVVEIEDHREQGDDSEPVVRYTLDVVVRCKVVKHLFSSKKDVPPELQNPVSYGPMIKALTVHLRLKGTISYKRLSNIFNEMTLGAINVSPATLEGFIREGALNAIKSGDMLRIESSVINSRVMGVDDTTFKTNTKPETAEGEAWKAESPLIVFTGKTSKGYMRVYITKESCIFSVHTQKNENGLDKDGIYAKFGGTAITDCEKKFLKQACLHALCHAHLLRELEAVANLGDAEGNPDATKWARETQALQMAMKKEKDQALEAKLDEFPAERIEFFRGKWLELAEMGVASALKFQEKAKSRKKAEALSARMVERVDEYLRFLMDLEVPFTNNASESGLRPEKIAMKVSGCDRSWSGRIYKSILRSMTITCDKQRLPYLKSLVALFEGKAILECLNVEPVPMRESMVISWFKKGTFYDPSLDEAPTKVVDSDKK
jgi:transposase